jgi:hypothetical protein
VTDWPTVVLALGVGLLGVFGTLGAVILQHRFARSDSKAAERREQIAIGAAALGPITTLLTNLDPDRLAINASEESLREIGALRLRWVQERRNPLATFALSHPSPKVRELGTRLDVDVEWVLARGPSLVREVLARRDFQPMHDLVSKYHRDARQVIDELTALLHGGSGAGGEPNAAALTTSPAPSER